MYMNPSAKDRVSLSKGVSVLNTSVIPMLNPFTPGRQRPRLETCSREPCGPRRLDKEREAALGPPSSGRRGPGKAEAQTKAMQP